MHIRWSKQPPQPRCGAGVGWRLILVALACVGAAATAPASVAEEGRSITAVSFGGSYAKASVKAYHEPFMQETGIDIRLDEYNGGLAQIRAQVETGNVNWDVVDLNATDVLRGCDEGLLEEIDYDALPPAPDGTPAVEDFVTTTLDCGVAVTIFADVYAYNKKNFPGAKPTTVGDFFDMEKFPGRRGMRRRPNSTLEFALVADGVPADAVYEVLSTPEGMDRAFRKLDSIKSQVVWWEAGAQPPQMLVDGEVVMSTAFNGRIFNAQFLEDQPLAIVWDGQVQSSSYLGVVADSPNAGLARQFVAFAGSTQSIANLAGYISYGIARRSAMPLVGKHFEVGVEMRPHLPTAPENMTNVVVQDFEWWADHQDDMNERFAAWLIK